MFLSQSLSESRNTRKNVPKATLTDWDELAKKQNADLDYKHDLDEIEKLRNQMKNAKGR